MYRGATYRKEREDCAAYKTGLFTLKRPRWKDRVSGFYWFLYTFECVHLCIFFCVELQEHFLQFSTVFKRLRQHTVQKRQSRLFAC